MVDSLTKTMQQRCHESATSRKSSWGERSAASGKTNPRGQGQVERKQGTATHGLLCSEATIASTKPASNGRAEGQARGGREENERARERILTGLLACLLIIISSISISIIIPVPAWNRPRALQDYTDFLYTSMLLSE